MKILLFGGSFDPPHKGHIRLLHAALRRIKPDEAYVLPARRSPLKAGPRARPAHRLKMLSLALKELPLAQKRLVRVDPFELRRARTTYAYENIGRMRRLHPKAELYFLVGSDAAADLPSWRRPRALRRCFWIAGKRPATRLPKNRPAFRILPGPFPKISSTEIRARLLCGENVSALTSPRVLRYIRRQGLYGLRIHKWLSRNLFRERYAHTLCVAKNARALALKHGLDQEKAALAGLLHDCGRSLPAERLARYALKARLSIPHLRETAKRQPLLLHAYVSADLARRLFGVQDREVLSAVRKHTLGDLAMTDMDRLLYVADACSADRRFAEASRIRRLAGRSLRQALRATLRAKLDHAAAEGRWIHPMGKALRRRILNHG